MNIHLGSSIDSFLKEEDEALFADAQARAIKEVIAWQLAAEMRKNKITKSKMAAMLHTSRTQVDRLLDAREDVTLNTLQKAAAIVGKRVVVELV